MERYPVGLTATISATFTDSGGATVDPGTVTIGITRADGTVLVAPLTATGGSGVAARTYALSAANMALLDTLTATWTSATLGTLTSTVEVVGGFLFTVAEARLTDPLQDTAEYPTSAIITARTLAEQALEDACDIAFVPRYGTETLDGSGGASLFLTRPRVTAIRSVTVAGAAYTAGQLADLVARPTGLLINTGGAWPAGYGNVVVTYEHGYPYPPERVKRAARMLAKRWLVEGPVDERATSFSSEDGTFALMTPGLRGALFDLPEVEAVVQQYGMRVGIA